MENIRTLIYYGHYFSDFYNGQSEKVKAKIDYVLYVLTVAERIPKKHFLHITKGLYEIRVEYESNIYRIFSCFDEGRIVGLFNGYQKKSQKTPHTEIDKALHILNEYFNEKRLN